MVFSGLVKQEQVNSSSVVYLICMWYELQACGYTLSTSLSSWRLVGWGVEGRGLGRCSSTTCSVMFCRWSF